MATYRSIRQLLVGSARPDHCGLEQSAGTPWEPARVETAMVDYIGVSDIQRLVHRVGTGEFIERLAREIEADYRRWSEFEKSARLASHSPVGVIELMPTSDGRLYSFKYVNGHPK